MLERKLNIKMIYTQLPWRESDQKVFVADIQKVSKVVGWIPEVSKDQGIQLMINWLKSYE